MGLLLILAVGLGLVVASQTKTKKVPAPGAGGGIPAVDPASANPLLGGPRIQNVAGVMTMTLPWNDVATLRMARYAPGTGQTTIDGLPGGGGAKITGTFTFKDDLKTLTPEQISSRSVIRWATEQAAKGLAIVVSDALITGPFTEDAAHTTQANPFLPTSITVMAVPVLALSTVTAAGTGMVALA